MPDEGFPVAPYYVCAVCKRRLMSVSWQGVSRLRHLRTPKDGHWPKALEDDDGRRAIWQEQVSAPTIWMYGEVDSNYHDLSCKCDHHCRNCFENLLTGSYPNPRTRYCGDYCKNLAKRDRALSRALSQVQHG